MSNRGQLFILSAPAGTGKTTLMGRLLKEVPNLDQSVSYTTRPPREGEASDGHYRFVTRDVFEEMIAREEFLEYVLLYGDYYGTSKKALEEKLSRGKKVVLVIDSQGAMKLKGKVEATTIFVLPPSLEELKRRLTHRGSESEAKIKQRLAVAENEIGRKSEYDYIVVNDDLEKALDQLKKIIIGVEA
jgi:guanylate kinase